MKHLDKIKHLAVFTGGFAIVLVASAKLFPDVSEIGRVAIATAIQALAAFLTEDAQRHQEGRVKDGWDAFADMVAIPFGLAAYMLLQQAGLL